MSPHLEDSVEERRLLAQFYAGKSRWCWENNEIRRKWTRIVEKVASYVYVGNLVWKSYGYVKCEQSGKFSSFVLTFADIFLVLCYPAHIQRIWHTIYCKLDRKPRAREQLSDAHRASPQSTQHKSLRLGDEEALRRGRDLQPSDSHRLHWWRAQRRWAQAFTESSLATVRWYN